MRERGASRVPATAVAPALWLFLFVALPLALVLVYSVSRRDLTGGVREGFTLEAWRAVADPLVFRVLFRSLAVAAASTLLTLLVAWPVAFFAAFSPPRLKTALLVLVVLPFWTSLMIRLYALTVLLGDAGLVNRLLVGSGLLSAPLPLGGNAFAVQLGLLYANLPFAVLPIFASLDRLDPSVVEAAMDLGAGPRRVLLDIVLPASLPGVASALVLCFVPTLGNFVVPQFLGGPDDLMFGNVVTSAFLEGRNWPFGSALGAALLFLSALLVFLHLRFGGSERGAAIPGGGAV